MENLIVTWSLLLLLAIPAFSFNENKWKNEQESDRVKRLPGQPPASFAQYAGYVPISKHSSRALFYWLTEATTEPAKKPLVLWLNGGPGCSSIAYGAAEEIGPFKIYENGTGLYNNPYSWNTVANLLFLESPAGVGFSVSNVSVAKDSFGDTRTAKDAYIFLVNWFARFPNYRDREFYILGESYAGHYVPQLAKLVHNGNAKPSNVKINLKGFMVGNAVTDWYYDNMGIVDYYWTHALISDETYSNIKAHCDFKTVRNSKKCQHFMDYAADEELGNVDLHSIYTPVCLVAAWAKSSRRSAIHWNPLWMGQSGFDPCTPSYAAKYFNRKDVQTALHANVTGIAYPWTPCNYDIVEKYGDKAFSVIPVYEELIKAGLRIWVYSGDEDAMVPVTGTRYWIRSMGLATKLRWYPWYHDGQVAGWTQVFHGLTFATIRGAPHEVPVLQPERSLALLQSYISGMPLPRK